MASGKKNMFRVSQSKSVSKNFPGNQNKVMVNEGITIGRTTGVWHRSRGSLMVRKWRSFRSWAMHLVKILRASRNCCSTDSVAYFSAFSKNIFWSCLTLQRSCLLARLIVVVTPNTTWF